MMSRIAHEEFIAKTEAFISKNGAWLESTVNSIGWSMKDLALITEANRPNFVSCHLNPEHRVPAQSLETHVLKCEKNNGTYPDVANLNIRIAVDVSLIYWKFQCSFSYHTYFECTTSVLDTEYDHVTAQELDKASASTKRSSSSQTLAELLQAERDAKRRRAAHRGKRVHSNKKSYNEVMREVIANQMLTLDGSVDNEESCDRNSKSEVQESVTPNPSFLGVGEPFCRGNPYKRWLTIEREEKATMKKLQEQASECTQDKQREEGRNVRCSQSDTDRRASHRDYREDGRRHYKSGEYSRNSRERESWLRKDRGEIRRKTEVKVPEKYRQARSDNSNEHRNDHWNHDLKNEKRENRVKSTYESEKFQNSSGNDFQRNLEVGESGNTPRTSASERKRKHEEKEDCDDHTKKYHKKKKKKKEHKHKHEKKKRRSSSSS